MKYGFLLIFVRNNTKINKKIFKIIFINGIINKEILNTLNKRGVSE